LIAGRLVAEAIAQGVEDRPLSLQDLTRGGLGIEPSGPVDFGKLGRPA
jgi:hypothetical protein